MARRSVFYSFHFGNDVFRVHQVRNIGALEDNEPVSPSAWETVKRGGDAAIERWIDENMNRRQCVIVLVGSETAGRKWVKYEIEKTWKDGRGLFGIYIHNLRCPRAGTCYQGRNPFSDYNLDGRSFDSIVNCYDPGPDAYNTIRANMETWVERAIAQRK
jgi:hypothetical protein